MKNSKLEELGVSEINNSELIDITAGNPFVVTMGAIWVGVQLYKFGYEYAAKRLENHN